MKKLAPVTEVFGATVGSVQAAELRSRRAPSVPSALQWRKFIFQLRCEWSSSLNQVLKLDAQAAREDAGTGIDVVVDAVQPRGRIHTAVARNRERVVDGREETQLLAAPREPVAYRHVVHAQERPVLEVIVREILRSPEALLKDGG